MNTPTDTPRFRMFAGPNGSGKSTLKSLIKQDLLGIYVNPDEIEAEIRRLGSLDFDNFGIQAEPLELLDFLRQATLLKRAGLSPQVARLSVAQNKLNFSQVQVNAYFASVIAAFIRRQLILAQATFTIETVMSAPDKIELLAQARQHGYRTYLYFVATNDPLINVSRVRNRVKAGGHDVPTDKITTRYYRSLDLLWPAIQHTNRSYIFDNSGDDLLWLAEITEAKRIVLKIKSGPEWFKKYVLGKSG